VKMMHAGMALPDAIRMLSLNAARHLCRDDELGSIAVGKKADLVAFSARENFAVVSNVWVDGTRRLQAGITSQAQQHVA